MSRVYMLPKFGPEAGQGGIKRVCEKMEQLLPDYGIEFVDDINKADLISLHGTETVQNPKVPTVLNCHGLYWAGYPWASWAIKANLLLVNSMKRAKVVTVPSEFVANSVRRGMLLEPEICPHGVDTTEWQPQQSRQNYVLWAKNRIDPICDPSDMNRLAAKATGIRFVSTFGKPTDNVRIIGAMPLDDIKPYIQNAALFLGTTRETGAITCLESLASGVPVLGWRWGATAEIVAHRENGWLAEPGDYDGLLDGLYYCLNNLKELSANAREAAVSKFQWEDTIGRYAEVYDLALQQPTPGPTVSVIVTAYNLERYLPACIESVLNQDYKDVQLLIVDDNSPDGCGRIADEYAEKDSRIKVIHNRSNYYLAESRNIAIRKATGKYILPLDADDKLGQGALRILAGSLDRNLGIDVVTGSMKVVEEDGVTPWAQLSDTNGVSGWPTANPNYNEQINYHNQVPYASMYRKEVWERVGGYRRRMKTAEDAEYWTRIFSYGAVPAKVTNEVTLIYTNRSDSMSHKEPAVDWTAWFPWKKYPDLTPYGASGLPPKDQLFFDVNAYGPIEVSVIIPCGPGHDWYLQDALDSLTAQTFLNFEAIIVNDTGTPWFEGDKLINPHLQGFPWAKIIDSDGSNRGVAWARTTGTVAAKAPLVFYLDADDFLQPIALDVFVATQKAYGGWVYSDWYDQEGQHKSAQDWDATKLLTKMVGPMTGLYPKEDMLAVLFDDFGGWEDWDAQLSLLERGVCGTHVRHPLFTYRYQTGTRREDNFKKAGNLLEYVKKKHSRLYQDEEFKMSCGSCGRGGGKSGVSPRVGAKASKPAPPGSEDMVLIEYVGQMTQMQTISSKVRPSKKYYFGGNPGEDSRKLFVYAAELQRFTSSNDFVVAKVAPEPQPVTEELPVLEAFTRPAPPPVSFDEFMREQQTQIVEAVTPVQFLTQEVADEVRQEKFPVSQLKLSPETISILSAAGYETAEDLKLLSIAQLVSIKGIGATRATKIMQAVKEAVG